MTKEQIKEAFSDCGLGRLGDKLAYKLWVNGALKDCDVETLELFLESYEFHNDESVLLNHFIFHFQIFKRIFEHQDIPFQYYSFMR